MDNGMKQFEKLTESNASELEQCKKKLTQTEIKTTQLENIITLMPGNVYWVDYNGICLGCNKNLIDIMGFSSKQDIVGRSPYDFMPKEIAESTRANDQKIMMSGVAQSFEEQGFDKYGASATYLTKKVPLKDSSGAVIGLVGVSLDISERKLMESKLKGAKEKAEAANEAKTDFLDNMRHDIRTPLSNIVGLSAILESMEKDREKKEFINAIQVSGKALLDLMTKMLEFNNIEIGRKPLVQHKFNLGKLIIDLVEMNEAGIANKHIELIVDYDKNIPDQVIGDRERIHRILLNLISNAIKFTEAGSIKITAKVAKKNKRTITLKLIVQDTGVGIPENAFNFIFEKFNRLTHSYSGVYKGEGLGLYIVKRFIDELDGEIEVASKVGEGTTFTCIIPLKLPLLNSN